MLRINKRQSELLQQIKDNGTMSVNDILPLFDVSAATVRKDLSLLEKSGLVVRTRGEVHLSEKIAVMTPIESRSNIHNEAKVAIARAAVELIKNGDSIILDSGSTTAEIAKLLVNRQNITVLTNSIPVANILASSSISVNMSGGILLGQNFSTQGPEAENYFKRVEVDKAFISCSGVRSDIGLAASNALEGSVKHCMMKAANKVFAVLDSSKFTHSSINLFADFSELDYIITELPISDPALAKRFEELNLECIIAGGNENK